MYDALNAERSRQGVTPVAWSTELAAAATGHSADMAANGFPEPEPVSDEQTRADREQGELDSTPGHREIDEHRRLPA